MAVILIRRADWEALSDARRQALREMTATPLLGQPAFGTYLHSPDGVRRGTGLFVITCAGDRVSAMVRFENSMLPWFGLPRSLPG